MIKRFLLLITFLAVCASSVYAQQDMGNIVGQVVTRIGRAPIENAKITVNTAPSATVVYTNSDGFFTIQMIPYGMYTLNVDALDFQLAQVSVKLDAPERDVNYISLIPIMRNNDIDDTSFTEFDTDTGDMGSMPAVLSASRDVFDNIVNYNFSSIMRFRTRGYDPASQNVYMNGIYLNDANTGYTPWSLWTGLNDVTRNQENVSGLTFLDYGPGSINGMTNIDSRASSIRKGFRASAVTADAQYRMRLMFTYGSGRRDDGWAFAFSASTRQFDNEHVDGVYYNAWGFYGGVEKFFGRHRLSLTGLVVPTERGVQSAATQETYDLVGNNMYNPNWGYQAGKQRNARVRTYVEPLIMFNYEFKVTEETRLIAATSYRFGKNAYSALDWYDAADPRPDYYRNLPSYFAIRGEDAKALQAWEAWRNNTDGIQQINWALLYDVNRNSNQTFIDNKGNVMPEGRSKYILSDRHTDQRDFNVNLQLAQMINANSDLNLGVNYRWNRTEYYNKVKDLLGGEYWVNVDNFAERDLATMYIIESAMNDVSGNDNLIVYEGDKYGHNYYAHIRSARLWSTYNLRTGQFEFNLAGEAGMTTFWREGLYRKGLFPDGNDSYGNSQVSDFFTYKLKGYVTYKLSGAHQFTLGGLLEQDAPFFRDAFVSPRTRNQLVSNLKAETVRSWDFTYNMRMPWLTLRASFFYTTIEDQAKIISFYDDTQRTFVNYAMTGIDQRHIGAELGFKAPIYGGLSIGGALSWGNYTYTSNPTYTQTRDNSADILIENDVVLWSGYKVESTPQVAAGIQLDYRTNNNWFIGLDFNFFDNMYISMNPLYRAYSVLTLIPEEQRDVITNQYKFEKSFVMNFNIGKYWYIGSNMLGVNLSVKNLMNDTNIKTGGFEQMRLYRNDRSTVQYQKFGEKYYYGYGINYYLNVYFRF